MNSKKNSILLTYIIMFIYLIISIIFSFTNMAQIYVNIVNPILLLMLSFVVFFITSGGHLRNHHRYEKIQNIIIIILGYILIYFLSGYIFGFVKNSYSLSLSGIITNFISIFVILFFKEYIRYKMIYFDKSKFNLVLVTILFILIDIDFSYLFNLSSNMSLFTYFMSSIVPIIILNSTYSYLTYRTNYLPSMLYRMVLTGIMLFSPILPDLNWVMTDFIYIVLFILFMNSVDSLVSKENHDIKKEKSSLKDNIIFGIFIFMIFIFVLFVIGVFKYQPIAVMSDSMKDYFARGDMLIIEKLDEGEKDELEVGDIIYYSRNGSYITHRIVEIDGDTYYTKGDNNDDVDFWTVDKDDIDGVIKFRIKYLGYPSVWLYELLD